MSKGCHSSSNSNKGNGRLGWLGYGGFLVIVVLLWAFDGNPLVSQLALPVLLVLIVIWFVVSVVRRMGVG